MNTEKIWEQFRQELAQANRDQIRCTVLLKELSDIIEFYKAPDLEHNSGKSKIYLFYNEVAPAENLLRHFNLQLKYIDPSYEPEFSILLYQAVPL